MIEESKANTIAQLNDRLRKTLLGGKVVITEGIQALPDTHRQEVILAVQGFNTFPKDDDPYGEHDFGMLICQGAKIYFKIDYYDLEMLYLSVDPADPAKTKRVLTIMLAEEY